MGRKVIALSRTLKVIVGLLAIVAVLEFTISYKTVQMCAFNLGLGLPKWSTDKPRQCVIVGRLNKEVGKMRFERQSSFYKDLETFKTDRDIMDCDLDEEILVGREETGKKLEAGNETKCLLYRIPEELGMGKGIGYCDMDNNSTTCEGDVKSCEKSYALK